MTNRRSAPRFSRGDEARLQHAMKAGLRAERDGLISGRAQVMRELAEFPRDGTADDDRQWLLLLLDAFNRHVPHATALAGDDDELE